MAVNYELRELHADDGCTALSLGDAALTPLKTFLRKEAKKLHRENLAKTFVLVDFVVAQVLQQIMPHTGCRFLVVDAKPNSIAFYEGKGFRQVRQEVDGEQALRPCSSTCTA